MRNTKLIFVGPVGAGKTTAVQTMASASLLATDEQASDMTRQRKQMTTVAMDYGIVADGTRRLHLYGTPGQERFSFMWDIVTQGGDGLILLLDNSRPRPFQDMHFFLRQYQPYAQCGKIVLGVTKTDLAQQGPSVDDYQEELCKAGLNLAVAAADVRQKAQVSRLIDLLLPFADHPCDSMGKSSVA